VDLPFAVPTAVAGIALTAVWSETGFPGSIFTHLGLQTAYSRAGVFIAMLFVGLPFVVRNVQPVVETLDRRLEEAGQTLGAGPVTVFFRVTLHSLMPALIAGFSLSFARALGEYGSIVFISGNLPFKTEIAPLLIMTKLEQYNYNGAVAIALVMLFASFTILFMVNGLHWRAENTKRGAVKRKGGVR
ncbi:MAG: ABC transporter permease subunit, partial [Deltaproteobacteria bacterium]|nr:ABC transporter permease subunit [Deltaproteobacteria bacterium]